MKTAFKVDESRECGMVSCIVLCRTRDRLMELDDGQVHRYGQGNVRVLGRRSESLRPRGSRNRTISWIFPRMRGMIGLTVIVVESSTELLEVSLKMEARQNLVFQSPEKISRFFPRRLNNFVESRTVSPPPWFD